MERVDDLKPRHVGRQVGGRAAGSVARNLIRKVREIAATIDVRETENWTPARNGFGGMGLLEALHRRRPRRGYAPMRQAEIVSDYKALARILSN